LKASRPRLAYFALGGTIASAGPPGHGALVVLTGVGSFRQVPSVDLTVADMLALAKEVRRSLRDGVDAHW
jgi:L-asparaginase/Glu-tRNA(Gln) amidotransferase subunit D